MDHMLNRHLIVVCAMAIPMMMTMTGISSEAAEVMLTQETPCIAGQSSRLRCSVTSGTIVHGLHFTWRSVDIVRCDTGSPLNCFVNIIGDFCRLTQENTTTSYLDIMNCDSTFGLGHWSCSDGAQGTKSSIQIIQNVLPSGLTYGSTCERGRVTSPAFLNCSLDIPGDPPATVSLHSSSNQILKSSQSGSVTGTVTRGGQASCSVMWSAFPSFPLNISPVLCDVQVPPRLFPKGVQNVTVREGHSVTLTCVALGYPRPTITWSHQGSTVSMDVDDTVTRGSLTLTPDRSGGVSQRVACAASNPAGSELLNFYFLFLQFPPAGPPVISGLPPDGVVTIGDDVTLTCKVSEASPPVSNVTLTCPRHSTTSQGDVTSLTFTVVSKNQGSCVCSAFHVLGYSLTASLSLHVLALPVTCDHTTPVAAGVVVTFIVSVISTLAVVFVVLRRRHRGVKEPTKTDIYENTDFDMGMTSQERGERVTSPQSEAAIVPTQREEGGYSVLDLHTRERPRDVTAYEVIERRGLHGDQGSRDSGSQGNQAYAN